MSTTVESLELQIQSNSTSAAKGIDALTQSLNNLKSATKGLGLSNVAKGIGQVSDATSKASKSNKDASKSFTDLYFKLKTAASGFKAVGKAIYSAIEKSSDYVENVNLFTVSMGQYADEAKQYAETVGEAMGIDPGEWMRNQGVFMTLATGFGVAGDRAAVMSKNLTQLGYDLSSFFNISYEDAMQKLQSGLSGELEPLRRIGYDLSQAKLEATALELGIDKTVSSMTQAEKAQLRYYAIMTQVTTAQGDMARTLNAPANQLRMFTAQVNMAAREIGNVFIPALNAILPYAIAVVKVIRILASVIASLFGYEMPEVDYSGVDSMGNAATDTSDALENATESAKKLKSYMLGFDELNVINPNEGSSSSDIGDTSGGFDFELPEYNFMDSLVNSKVADIVEDMKEWLGITDDIDTWSELMNTRFGSILTSVGLIAIGLAGWKVTQEFLNSITLLKTLLSSPSFAITISATLAVVGFALAFDGMRKAIEEGLNGFNFAEIIGGSLLGTGAVAYLASIIATWIDGAFGSSAVSLALTQAGINLGVGTAGAAGAALAAGVAGIVFGIPMMFVGIYDACVNGIDWLSATLVGVGATAAGAGIGTIIGACGGPIGAGIGALIGLAIGLIVDFTILLWQKFDSIVEWFNSLPLLGKLVALAFGNMIIGLIGPLAMIPVAIVLVSKAIEGLIEFVKELPAKISEFFASLPETISNAFTTIDEWVKNLPTTVQNKLDEIGQYLDALPETISTWFANLRENVKTWFEDLWQPIKDYDWTQLGTDIGTWFGSAVKSAFTFVTETVPQWFADVGEAIITGFDLFFTETLPTFFTETVPTVVQSIADFFIELPGRIKEIVVSTWDGFIGVGAEILNGIFEGINTIDTAISEFCAGFLSGFKEGLGIKGESSTEFDSMGGKLITGLLKGIKGKWSQITDYFDTAFANLNKKFSTAWGTLKTTVTDIFDEMWKKLKTSMNSIIGGVEKMTNGVIKGFNKMINALNKLSFSVPSWIPEIGGKSFGFNLSTLSEITIPRLAEGGFVDEGQMFIAREAGPEMVGSIGRRTAVANNDQIVGGIASGVAEANEEQNMLLREQNSLLRSILEKDSGVYLDGKNLTNSVEKYQRERGRVLITGGVL